MATSSPHACCSTPVPTSRRPRPDGFTPLLVATVRGRTAVATLLLERGANPNHTAPGFTALHWASGVWETELTGPRGIAAQRDEEWRALGGITEGKPEFVRALLAHGADPNARIVKPPQRVGFTLGGLNLVGATPYLVAAAGGDAAVMRLLAQAGAMRPSPPSRARRR